MLKRPNSILIVEDEDIIRTSLREFLQEEGYDVAVAGSVVNGMIQAKRQDFDVAICDVQLPDGDGLDLLRRLQQLNPSLSGLIITAYATVENAVEAFKSGAFDYLVKPVIFDDLANKLRQAFRIPRTVPGKSSTASRIVSTRQQRRNHRIEQSHSASARCDPQGGRHQRDAATRRRIGHGQRIVCQNGALLGPRK